MILLIIAMIFLIIEALTLTLSLLMHINAPKLLAQSQDLHEKKDQPLVSILIPAHNEAKHLKACLQSLVKQNYPNLELIVINDRSKDETQTIIDIFCHQYTFCHGVTINTLPDDWLGKPHALQKGLNQANGVYCLLTDADVIHSSWVVSATVAICQDKQLDYCTLGPSITPASRTLSWFMPYLGYVLYLTLHPWRMNSRIFYKATGIGAFNFAKTSLLRKTNAFEAVALDPIDDVGIAKVMGKKSKKGAFLVGNKAITLDWYPSLPALAKGLEKNLYRQFNYQKLTFFLSLLMLLVVLFRWNRSQKNLK